MSKGKAAIVTAPADGAERYKAYRIRRKQDKGKPLTPDESAFMADYDGAKSSARQASEKITYSEERHLAEAESDNPMSAAFAALIPTAEGLRADTLMRILVKGLSTVVDMHMRMAEHLLARTEAIEKAHVEMLEAVRDSHLARAEAEGQALLLDQMVDKLKEGGDEDAQMIAILKLLLEKKRGGVDRKGKRKKPLGAIDHGGS